MSSAFVTCDGTYLGFDLNLRIQFVGCKEERSTLAGRACPLWATCMMTMREI